MANNGQVLAPDHNSNSCLVVDGTDQLAHYFSNKELGTVPTSIYISSLPNNKDLSYDDLSKNFDANLAEIDMETFRTEDIHSILTLPVMYSGDFQCSSHGEQCASMSNSLLSGIELDSSAGVVSAPTTSEEEEIFISKNEPLFSPVRDNPLPNGAISVDSLDCSSMEDHDLVMTCRANKNNYTIVFEGSGTEESDYLEVGGSSDGEDLSWRNRLGPSSSTADSMVRSALPYTTWSKLRHTQEPSKEGNYSSSPKSQSLPNLLRHSMIADNLASAWPQPLDQKNGCVRLFDLQNSQHSNVSTDTPHSVSLLKLYMKQKSLSCSENEDTSKECISLNGNSDQQTLETNNNTINLTDNNYQVTPTPDDDNSLYLEDSLMDGRIASQMKDFQTSPIKEEDEPTDSSTGDETMKSEKDESSTEGNNGKPLLTKLTTTGHQNSIPFNVDRASNVFPLKRSNAVQVVMSKDDKMDNRLDRSTITQGTQTKHHSSDAVFSSPNTRSNSRDPSPSSSSSGYLSSRHCSERYLHHGSSNIVYHQISSTESNRKSTSSVIIERPCCRSTQIPVHIKDQAVQTSLVASLANPANFMIKETQTSACNKSSKDQSVSEMTPRRSIYVCYPNYSLPDLSFLKGLSQSSSTSDEVYLTPTKHVMPDMETASPTIKVRPRPKSCTDTEPLSPKPSHIRDWDSLSVLLPDELKNAILRLSLSKEKSFGIGKRYSSPSPSRGSRASPTPVIQRNVPKTLLKKSSSSNTCASDKGAKAKSKRYSLQEPYHYYSPSVSSPDTSSSSQAKPINCLEESLSDIQSEEGLEEWPPQEFVITPTSPSSGTPNTDMYQLELNKKSKILSDLQEAIQKLCQHFEGATDKKAKVRLGSSTITPSIGPKVTQLCGALEAVLLDGLQPFIPGLFGMISNSVWKLVEASIKQGQCKKEVADLIHNTRPKEEHSGRKIAGFLVGLINQGNLEWWLGHLLGSCEPLIQHYYQPNALLRLVTLPALSHLRDELREMVSPLSQLPFHILLTQHHFQPQQPPILLTRTKLPIMEAPTINRPKQATWDTGVVSHLNLQHHTAGKSTPCTTADTTPSSTTTPTPDQIWPGVTVYPFVAKPDQPSEYKFQKLRQKWEQMSKEPKSTPDQQPHQPQPQLQQRKQPTSTLPTASKPPISPKKHTINDSQPNASATGHSSRSSIPRSKLHHPERSTTPRRSLIPVHKSTVNRRSSSLGKD